MALALRGKRRGAAVVGVLVFVNFFEIMPLYLGRASVPVGSRSSRALLLNLNTENRSYGKVLEFIRALQPDFMVLQEVNRAWAEQLGELQGDYAFSRACAREDNFGIAMFSRVPFEHAEVRYIGQADVPSIVVRFVLGGQPLTVIATHPLPPSSRAYASYRNEQLRELGVLVASLSDQVMVLGDLNTTSWSPFFRDLIRKTGLRDSRKGHGIQPTWPAGLPILSVPIDHCLVSEGIIVHNRWVGRDVGSDHYPVVVEFSIEPDVVDTGPGGRSP